MDSESSPRRAETNRIQDDSFSFDQSSGLKINRAGEVNLVNFVDLFRRARTKQRSRGRGEAGADRSDIRRRRRIKIKKDPGARAQHSREINSARNQIDTSEQSKREQNNFRSWVSKEFMMIKKVLVINRIFFHSHPFTVLMDFNGAGDRLFLNHKYFG